jgi:hypothetical protein
MIVGLELVYFILDDAIQSGSTPRILQINSFKNRVNTDIEETNYQLHLVAQFAEGWARKPKVAGSIPSAVKKFFTKYVGCTAHEAICR